MEPLNDYSSYEALANNNKCLLASQELKAVLYSIDVCRLKRSVEGYIALHPDMFTEEERGHNVCECLEGKGCFVEHNLYWATMDLDKTDCPTCKNTLEKIKDLTLGEDVQEDRPEFGRMRFYELATCTPITNMLDEYHMDQVQRVERQLQNGDPVSTQDTHRFLESSINILQTAAYQPGLPIEIQAKLSRSTEILLLLKDFDLDVSVFKEANLEARNRQRKEHRDMFHIITNSNLGLQSLRMECTCC